ncbi:hypothetical protein PTE30175_00301 [Pandoraea terrae]|uniref:Lipoprotein n=1 Tax=Pandoraea terrae TaxID=1537710 RepID=A0A5E4RPY1_9BURK|nr:hypothetical protein PTE30175_00301 [Pandoraea terrae]
MKYLAFATVGAFMVGCISIAPTKFEAAASQVVAHLFALLH